MVGFVGFVGVVRVVMDRVVGWQGARVIGQGKVAAWAVGGEVVVGGRSSRNGGGLRARD